MKYTNASELARLAGLSRERVGQLLARGDIDAVRAFVGDHPAWRIPCRAANRWLRERGIEPPTWVKRVGAVGAIEDVYVALDKFTPRV